MPADRVPQPGPLRRFTLGSGPLKRTSDRLQFLSRLVLLLAVLVVVPLSAVVGSSVSGNLHAVARQQAAVRTSVPATLLFDAATGDRATTPTPAVWAGADGVPRTGTVPAPAGERAGSVVRVWVDATGRLTTAPLGDGDIAADTVAAVVLGPGSALALLGLAHVVLVIVLDRRRARRWAEGWAAVEPLWRAGRP